MYVIKIKRTSENFLMYLTKISKILLGNCGVIKNEEK